MKFMEKAKRFFTLNAANHEGFTLVELIVVIAILAILAGVAVPAYSGYIKKAEKAGDLQIVGAINEAFQAACMVQNLDARQLTGATLAWTGKCVTGIASASGAGVDADKLNSEFLMFFAGNTTTEFKVLDGKLVFKGGVFVEAGEGATVSLPGGGTVTLTPAQLELLKGSTYATDIGGLMGQVDNVSGLVYDLLDGTGKTTEIIKAFTESEDYQKNMIAALGGEYDPNGGTVAQQYSKVFGEYTNQKALEKVAKDLGIDVEDVDLDFDPEHIGAYNNAITEVTNQANKNMLIMGVAQNAAKQDAADVMTIINGENPKGALVAAMAGVNGADGMGQAALVYGAFTAYAMAEGSGASDAAKAAIKNDEDPTAVFDLMTGEELANFQAYMAKTEGKNDLNACIEAMGVIENTSKDQDAVAGLMTNGFANDEFVGALQELLK